MNEFIIRFEFEKGHADVYEIKGESREALLRHIIGHKDWFFIEDDVAINMKLVTKVSCQTPGLSYGA